jgi:hypothetical protein
MNENIDTSWINSEIDSLPRYNWLYKFACFILYRNKRKMKYKEMYAILLELTRDKMGEDKAKQKALNEILHIYKFLNNNKLPEGIK